MTVNNSEMKLMQLIWENEPVRSGDLVKIAYDSLDWKKSTVYTVVKKLSDKQLIKNENTIISSLRKQESVLSDKSENVINKTYGGSLPMFLAAFLSREKLTKSEAEELKALIDMNTAEGGGM